MTNSAPAKRPAKNTVAKSRMVVRFILLFSFQYGFPLRGVENVVYRGSTSPHCSSRLIILSPPEHQHRVFTDFFSLSLYLSSLSLVAPSFSGCEAYRVGATRGCRPQQSTPS